MVQEWLRRGDFRIKTAQDPILHTASGVQFYEDEIFPSLRDTGIDSDKEGDSVEVDSTLWTECPCTCKPQVSKDPLDPDKTRHPTLPKTLDH
jgi:hypothetical protein